ncbi:MAG: hypothetical protein AB1505_10315 [Candidatus Latescibacterota bacterium]
MRVRAILLLLVLPCTLSVSAQQQSVTFTPAEMATWSYPHGLVEVTPTGTQVRRFGKVSNAVADMDQYSLGAIGEHGTPEHRVWTPSNAAQVRRLVDQDYGTWWKPNPADPLSRWWVEIDLGRAVVGSRIRLTFPDTVGARPFAFFSVYVSPGVPLQTADTQITYTRIGRPINNNTRSVVELDVRTFDQAVATGEFLVTQDSLAFDLFRFVRFEAAGQNPDAALAEIEVEEVGLNLSTRVTTETRLQRGEEVWGGRAWTSGERDCEVCGKGQAPEGLIDGDLAGRYWTIEAGYQGMADWRQWGNWWGVDLGSVFRIDRIVMVPFVLSETPFLYGYDRERQGPWNLWFLMTSDGTPSNTAVADVEGPYEYEMLSSINNSSAPKRHYFDLQFPSRRARFVFWGKTSLTEGSWQRASQIFVFHAEGYPAQVMLESEDIDLGGALGVQRLEWDADIPPGTSIEVETQTGNGYQTIKRYYLANGREVTQQEWEAAKARQRGDVVEASVRDPSWSGWSLPHRFSGQEFQSPTPRRWLRIRVRLISEDPEAMPSLRSLSFVANSPVIVGGLTGEVTPREAALDSLQEFRYVIRPLRPESRDAGFDGVLIVIPPQATSAEFVAARVGGVEVRATALVRGDSLLVDLPGALVKRDSVEVLFRTRLSESPSVFDAFVLNAAQGGATQGVVPATLGADQVYVPEATAATSFVQELAYSEAFTPNGDGTGDVFDLGFTLVKAQGEPQVRIYSLDGTLVSRLASAAPLPRLRYAWDGRDLAGQAVPPGIYILRVQVETDARDEAVQRLVHVVY